MCICLVQWPSLLRPRSPIMGNMPAMVLERYNACQTVCFCGIFPELKRAWASVDNSFFMWRFDRWWALPYISRRAYQRIAVDTRTCPAADQQSPVPANDYSQHETPVALCRRDDVPMEYSGEEQAITSVGMVRPRPGVFVEAIQQILVLCTTVEVRRGASLSCACRSMELRGHLQHAKVCSARPGASVLPGGHAQALLFDKIPPSYY